MLGAFMNGLGMADKPACFLARRPQAFGHVALLDHTGFSLETNERVGLIGRNGAGKSSLLKILGGLAKPDDGTLQVQQGTRIAFVEQEPALDPDATIFQAASAGLAGVIALRDNTWPTPMAWTWTPANPDRSGRRLELGAARGRNPAAPAPEPERAWATCRAAPKSAWRWPRRW
jgi:energy-coupling factor transporter ATP-binding protein EcfA2